MFKYYLECIVLNLTSNANNYLIDEKSFDIEYFLFYIDYFVILHIKDN